MSDCPFCEYRGPSEILAANRWAYVIEPIDPVVDGHVLVIPFMHVEDFTQWTAGLCETMDFAAWWAGQAGGEWNLITSKGAAATQTVRHLHFHLVPREEGDGLALPWSDSARDELLAAVREHWRNKYRGRDASVPIEPEDRRLYEVSTRLRELRDG